MSIVFLQLPEVKSKAEWGCILILLSTQYRAPLPLAEQLRLV
jgi:hypothetical protein